MKETTYGCPNCGHTLSPEKIINIKIKQKTPRPPVWNCLLISALALTAIYLFFHPIEFFRHCTFGMNRHLMRVHLRIL